MAEKDTEKQDKSHAEKLVARIEKGNRQALEAEQVDMAARPQEIREGQVYEDLAAAMDDIGGGRRRLKVLLVDGDQVLVENLSTLVHSSIREDRLLSDAFKRSV
jgi:hypothetical protein